MRAVLKFNLPDEEQQFMNAVKAEVLRLALHDFDQDLRHRSKFSEDDQEKAFWARDLLWRHLNDRGVKLHD